MFLLIMTQRLRKAVTFRLDELVLNALRDDADNSGISINRCLETHLFDYYKNLGRIPNNEKRLPDNRGGDRKSQKFLEEKP